ncbi:type IX secretion system membrane protein PorP/SprF, partial [Fulvivirga sp. RKSG066]|uniref:PorP/SprF family type IX secretion system membrane protein n=1 Tax=Fulvivirga aurantia TaxID=2529383 RepID=UPI0012BC946E
MKQLIAIIFVVILPRVASSQELPLYNHYFTYSYLYNPAAIANKEYTTVNLIYRQQWVGLDDAPEFIHAGLQTPLSENIALGLNFSNLEEGLFNSTTALLSTAYTVDFGFQKNLSFGLSVGSGRTSLDLDQIPDLSDPAINGALDENFYMEGQAGINLNLDR